MSNRNPARVALNLLSRGPALPLLTVIAVLLSGCASMYGQGQTPDPLQPVNRPVSVFNDEFDNYLLSPAAHYYTDVTPPVVRTGITHFFSNISYPNTIINDFFQAKLVQGVSDTGRFITNSTVGLAGLFDVATPLGMKQHQEDFGQTLGVWGSGPGPYLLLPVKGPSDARDAPGLAVATVTNLLFYVPQLYISVPLSVLGAINLRANLESAIQFRNQAAIDPYIFTREAYLQHRRFLIYDGNPPPPPLPDAGARDEGATQTQEPAAAPH